MKISRILFISFLSIVVLMPVALAGDVVIGDLLTVAWATNHSSSGGEFIMNPYSTSNFTPFNTFCVETTNYINPNNSTVYRVNGIGTVTINGGKQLTEKVAYLYYHFRKEDLAGYDHSYQDQTDLQNAIWYFMGLINLPANNPFVADANANAVAGNFYGVGILNLVTKDGGLAQDQLALVPDGGLTALLLGIGVGGLALFSRKLR